MISSHIPFVRIILSLTIFCGMTSSPAICSNNSVAKEVHLFEVENHENNSRLFILGSSHISRVAHLPSEAIEVFCSSDFIVEEIYEDDDITTAGRLIIDELIQKVKPHGLYRDGLNTGYLDLFLGDIPEGAKGWFEIIKPKIASERVKRFDDKAHALNFSDSSDMINRFHPFLWLLFLDNIEQMENGFAEEEDGMDEELCQIFKSAKKPVMHFETFLDRFKISLNLDFMGAVRRISEKPSYDQTDIEKFIESHNKEDKGPVSFSGIIENMLSTLRQWLAGLIELKSLKESLYNMETDEENRQKNLIEINNLADQIEELKMDIADKEQQVEIDADYLTGKIEKDDILEDHDDEVAIRNKNWLPLYHELLIKKNSTGSVVVGVGHLYGSCGLLRLSPKECSIRRWNLQTHKFEKWDPIALKYN